MNTKRIQVGNIMCGDKIYLENVVLLEYRKRYIPLGNISNYIKIYEIKQNKHILYRLLETTKSKGIYIDIDSLKPYYEKQSYKTFKKIKSEYNIKRETEVKEYIKKLISK